MNTRTCTALALLLVATVGYAQGTAYAIDSQLRLYRVDLSNASTSFLSNVTGAGAIFESLGTTPNGVLYGADTASNFFASVSGGAFNTASGLWSSVSGGTRNTASGLLASVSGGSNNTASGSYASASGGFSRTASGTYDWVAGGLFQNQ